MKKIMVCFSLVVLLFACALEGANVIGPAGGIVFYDKGSYSDGWRYLEASPKDAGEAEWGPNVTVNGLSTKIGKGKENTDLIIATFNTLNIRGTAVHLCTEFSYGGYTDWFLPSIEELEQIKKTAPHMFDYYGNYWSSSYNDYWVKSRNVRPVRRF